jgi:hypothetical protein
MGVRLAPPLIITSLAYQRKFTSFHLLLQSNVSQDEFLWRCAHSSRHDQGCQMAYFSNQKSRCGLILEGLASEDVGIFVCKFGQFYGYLVHFVILLIIWYIFPVLVCCTKKSLATLPPSLKRPPKTVFKMRFSLSHLNAGRQGNLGVEIHLKLFDVISTARDVFSKGLVLVYYAFVSLSHIFDKKFKLV